MFPPSPASFLITMIPFGLFDVFDMSLLITRSPQMMMSESVLPGKSRARSEYFLVPCTKSVLFTIFGELERLTFLVRSATFFLI